MDWGPSLDKLVTCSERRDVRIWRMRREDKVKQWEITGTCNEYTGEGMTWLRIHYSRVPQTMGWNVDCYYSNTVYKLPNVG